MGTVAKQVGEPGKLLSRLGGGRMNEIKKTEKSTMGPQRRKIKHKVAQMKTRQGAAAWAGVPSLCSLISS